MSNKILIASCTRHMGIGKDGDIPYPSDYAFFKKFTWNNLVIMGRKTWESLKAQPLPDRVNIVVSTTLPHGRWSKEKGGQTFYVVNSLEEALQLAQEKYSNLVHFIIGGASIYRQALDKKLVDTVLLTTFATEVQCDTYFPYSRRELELMFKKWKTFEVNNDGEIPLMRTYYTNEL